MSLLKDSTYLPARLESIDALRGLAALGVVLYHAVLQTRNAVPENIFRYPVELLQFLTSFGYIGVFLFFVISGFCIHLQWVRSAIAGTNQPISFGAFWRRRIRRLYPPYLIALALFLVLTAVTVGIDASRFFFYDLVMHLLMLHNLDPQTSYSINGVFWTLAIEEQLYLAYFLLLFLRQRWGWGLTLAACALARVGWFFLSHGIWVVTGVGIPVPEAAASHWFTWALGAISVEAAFGLIKVPRWCRNLWLGSAAILAASVISITLPQINKDTFVHNAAWLLMHPLWGFGFFALVNRAVNWEQRRLANEGASNTSLTARAVAVAAFIGVFSYSLYLTHELVIMQSWRFTVGILPPVLNTLLVLTPATVAFAWLFFRFCERPFMRQQTARIRRQVSPTEEVFPAAIPLVDEG